MKVCITCKQEKSLDSFTKDKSKPDGFYSICKHCLKEKRTKLKDVKKSYDEKYYLENKQIILEKKKIYQKSIPNDIRAKHNRTYRQKNKDKFNQWQLNYIKKNRAYFAYRTLLRNYIVRSKQNKNNTTENMLGYDVEKFKQRIEYQFKEGMSWNNRNMWHIDHKKPISAFNNNTSPRIINMLCNLQPIWKIDNLRKSNKF